MVNELVELNFWWGFLSGGVLIHTASALPSGGDFVFPTTAAVLTCPLWWSFESGIVRSHSSHGAVIWVLDFPVTGPGFDPS